MCGIVGYVGPKEAGPLLIEGLRRMEYRGYDSAGIATLSNGGFQVFRSQGKLGNLVAKLDGAPAPGATGIGHTRWATHGRPTEINAHPQSDCTGQIVVVHNGIFENFAERKAALKAAGHRFRSETDTEVFAHEVEAAFTGDLLAAVRAAVVAPQHEIARKWFSWQWLLDDGLVERLVGDGRLERVEPDRVTAPASA
jgi:glucosamine--fructose-6-phosphate aminotransferase (isomerizing)